ncbi:uracil-DNA glycosylase family protein [Undibacterium sp. Ji22W]|uniref:uracil-DNA glycosylase family protein n=1 Tax=Undibacterium sp. Ji22W TaxID=3413038 RepID=UPI003BF22DA4
MSNLREYYLRNLGIGEIWKSREFSAPANDAVLADTVLQRAPLVSMTESKSTGANTSALLPKISSSLHEIDKAIQDCNQCNLCRNFGKSQFAIAPNSLDILLVSEFAAPLQLDAQEKLIQNLMVALSLPSEFRTTMTFFRSSMFKACSPTSSELVASLDDVDACISFLRQEIEVAKPRAIFVLGERVAAALLGLTSETKLPDLRSSQHLYRNIPVFVTHGTLALLTDPMQKLDVWNDICKLNDALS